MTALTSRPTLPAPRIRGRKEERPSSDRAREAASGARASSVPATLSAGGFALLLKFYTTPGGSPVPGPDGSVGRVQLSRCS